MSVIMFLVVSVSSPSPSPLFRSSRHHHSDLPLVAAIDAPPTHPPTGTSHHHPMIPTIPSTIITPAISDVLAIVSAIAPPATSASTITPSPITVPLKLASCLLLVTPRPNRVFRLVISGVD